MKITVGILKTIRKKITPKKIRKVQVSILFIKLSTIKEPPNVVFNATQNRRPPVSVIIVEMVVNPVIKDHQVFLD